MAGVRFQFHGAPDELLELASSWAQEHVLHVAIERFFPDYAATTVAPNELVDEAHSLGDVKRVALRQKTPRHRRAFRGPNGEAQSRCADAESMSQQGGFVSGCPRTCEPGRRRAVVSMGVLALSVVLEDPDRFDWDAMLYLPDRPWTPDSRALVLPTDDLAPDEPSPPEAEHTGMHEVMTMSAVQDIVHNLIEQLDGRWPSLNARFSAFMHYTDNDAFIDAKQLGE
jgi:hypothetical protein